MLSGTCRLNCNRLIIREEFSFPCTTHRTNIINREVVEGDTRFNSPGRISLFLIVDISTDDTFISSHIINYRDFIFLTTSITVPSTHFIAATISSSNWGFCGFPHMFSGYFCPEVEILVRVLFKMGNRPEFLSQTRHLEAFSLQREQHSH